MAKKIIIHLIIYPLLIAGVVLGLFKGVQAAVDNIDSTNKYVWGANVGWINFAPADGGVTIYRDHLEGYAWGENVGWISLGRYTGGGSHTYLNTDQTNYGVNITATNVFTGYAWGANVGWINFNPTNGGVTIDWATGSLNGDAWGENVGWIRFKNTSPAYNVVVNSTSSNIYLPLICKDCVTGSDLIIVPGSLVASSSAITLQIQNVGNTATNNDFWVDVYFNPTQTPTLNKPWDTIAPAGATWGVTQPLTAGQVLALTVGGTYYDASESSSSFPSDANVYAYVDSVNYATTYGAVEESNENNNLSGPVPSTARAAVPITVDSSLISSENLPQR